ncbi:ABC transporter substrate-binding protein [Spirosoma endbachense]|uniref:ABC transporter substrate-binding protein n=1 Tax=Spirosoma endbachense TaxID=2666025 RepID=A0A6P1VMX4_9BACT|nr:ABC transporter substrate-binding protein [Spirosoma endbachense]QHV94641.1 ABC transporter substrate-binding protein [Spirosoma endbachense]
MNGRLSWLTLAAVSLLWLLNMQVALAQVSPDALKRYKAAVQLVQTGNYERAKTDLNAIILRDGPLAPYAHYYYAVAAFRQKNFNQARLMIKQLMTRYPDWHKLDDANYLFAAICMETGQFEDALEAIQEIKSPTLRADVTKLEQAFIARITDLNRLKQLNKEFPDDRIVGLTLIDFIQRTATDKDDLELSDRLTNRFGVPGTVVSRTTSTTPAATSATSSTTAVTPVRNTRSKGYYNVAVMFPFRVDEFNPEKRQRSNQYVYDLYDGIRLAKARLQDEGITVNLFAYDLDNDANKALELVNSPAFAQTDMIIGPLYVEPNRIVSAYANQNNILLLNPIATSSELVANQPMSFLVQPSLNQQALKVAEQVRALNGLRRAAIYFGSSRRDSLLALAYQNELKRQSYQIVDFRKLTGSAQTMADAMQLTGTTTPSRSMSTVTPVSLGHVFLASNNEEDGARLIDALSRRKVSGPLIATASAFDFYRNSASTFTRRDLYLLYPDFIDSAREPVTEFQEEYLAKRNTIPSVFASEGYDMMLFFGRQLAKNGPQLRNRNTLRSDTDDYLLSGFDYTQTNENQIVPIVKYADGRFIKVKE